MRSRVASRRSTVIAVAIAAAALYGATDLAHGRELFSRTCVACHGSDGSGGVHSAPLRTTQLSLGELMTTIGNGRNEMPAFGRVYKPEDLHDVAAYIVEELRKP